MDAIVNLLVVMSVLSVAAERVTNVLKMRNEKLRLTQQSVTKERERVYAISGRSILVGMAVALLVKADFFAILNSLEDPFKTLGWVRVENYKWMQTPATVNFVGFIYALIGCLVTGVGLGFGSKFWHDILGAVYEMRSITRKRKELLGAEAPADDQDNK